MIQYQVTESYTEDIPEMPPDPKTGRDSSDITPGGAETMQINIVDRNQHIQHEGDMGRLGKSE
jgi:CRP-like cAMP-binding protein